ncbi:ribosome rescue protein RqcH [Haloplanus aerogenes]|uniref:Archaeal Rqc2 homolog aRqcH n=1 Tax=Haloplanus aerogenes TaxID=660522 RepID=A0A3M0D8V9_9EURY|nr:ribosome rescue protein RqcH [Haloplanus aerogenes]AZH26428.1 fibronectin-binding domain-containing protein [Haloplanus aerogenes]RMB18108.1 putative ribosome quality control (RQC) complex YloA/Tae2 family protein [Haloplanus aerogenes]
MDAKRELTSVDLAALVTELNRYEGAKVDKAYLYDDDLLRFRMRDFDRGRVELLIEVGDVKRAHVADPDHVADAPGRPPNFAMMLRNRLSGADFAGVEQYEFDRILVFEFEREDANTRIVAELFGQGNVAVLDESGEVIRSLETVRLKSRTVAPGSQYGFPESRLHPLNVGYDAFVRRMEESDTDVVRTLATQLNFGGLYGEEICSRAGVDKALDIADADDEAYRALYDAIGRLAERLREGDFDPRIYLEDDRVVDVTPFPLHEREGLDEEAYDSFNAAVDDYFYRFEREPEEEKTGTERPDFEAEIAKQERIIEQQEGAIEGFEEEAEAERERAEALYANYDLVDEIISTVRDAREAGHGWDAIEETLAEGAERGIPAAEAVVDMNPKEGMVTIDLDGTRVPVDPSMGVEKNADRRYQEAKRVEEKKEGALAAIENTREELEAAKRRREEWEAGDEGEGEDEDESEEPRDVDWLSMSSVPIKQPEHWYEDFRWFHTSDGFLVVGGRNADENEALVKKYMEGNDRFFHAQAHGGPVTVLKATGPSEKARDVDFPQSSLDEAAQFAVAYSSVWKDGRFAGDAYMVEPDQVSKTPESGEYIEKGGFVIRGDRTYFRDVSASVAVGIQCEPETRVIGGPPSAVEPQAAASLRLEPGKFAQNDAAKMCYRKFKERFADDSFVRKIASPDRIQEFLPPGGSDIVDE